MYCKFVNHEHNASYTALQNNNAAQKPDKLGLQTSGSTRIIKLDTRKAGRKTNLPEDSIHVLIKRLYTVVDIKSSVFFHESKSKERQNALNLKH